jgi:hypothetical protein
VSSEIIRLISPSGEVEEGPAPWADWATAQGYRTPSESEAIQIGKIEQDRQYREVLKETVDSPMGKLAAGTGAVADTMTFGGFSKVLENVAPETAKTLQVAQEENPGTTNLGTAAGFAATVATGKPVFDAITGAGKVAGEAVEQVGGKLAGTVAKYATEGMVSTLPAATPEAILGDPEEAAEILMAGGLIGGTIGTTLSAGGNFTSRVLKGTREGIDEATTAVKGVVGDTRERFANAIEAARSKTASALGATGTGTSSVAQTAGDLAERAAPRLKDTLKNVEETQWEKVLGINTKTVRRQLIRKGTQLERPQELVEFAQKEGLLPKSLGSLEKLKFDAGKTLQEVEKRKDMAGEDLRFILSGIDKSKKYFADTGKLVDGLKGIAKDIDGYDLVGTEERQLRKLLQKVGPKLIDKEGAPKYIKLTELHDISKSLGKFIYRNKTNPAVNTEAVQDARWLIRGTIDDALSKGADKQFATLSGGKISSEWKALNKKYHDYSDLEIGLKNLIEQQGNNQFTGMSGLTFGITGGVVGGLPGAVAGYGLNYLRQEYGPQAAAILAQRARAALEQRDKVIGGAVTKFLNNAGNSLTTVASSVRPAARVKISEVSEFVTGKKASSPARALIDFSDHLASISSNPALLVNSISPVTGEVSSILPDLGMQMTGHAGRTVQYLQQEIPKRDAPPSPFESDDWTVADRDINSFERKLRAALDPFTVLEDMEEGTLDPDAMKTVQFLYPKFHAKLSQTILEQAGEKKRTYSREQRQRLSMLLGGGDTDRLLAPDYLALLQQSYGRPEANQTPDQMARGGNVNMPQSKGTELERVSSR